METESIQPKADCPWRQNPSDELSFEQRQCPKCGMDTIKGMRGSPDSICKNCGYKDPCCFD